MLESTMLTARARGRRWWVWLGAGVVMILLAAYVVSQARGGSLANTARVDSVAPEIVLPQLANGKPGALLALSSLRGRPVVVNFWATWCVPCRAEFPALDAKYRQYKDSQQLVVIAVDVTGDSGAEAAQKFVGELGVTFPIWLAQDARVENAFNVGALPTTAFIDRQGVIRDLVIGGPMTPEFIESELAKIF